MSNNSTLAAHRYAVNVPLAKIRVPENRLRELRDYSGLAESMDGLGLLSPITVTEADALVVGRHRLEAARSLGWKTIPAFVVEEDELANRLREIDENLKRLDLTVYEQAKHAAERERVLDALGQRARRGDNRHSRPATAAGLDKTTRDVAAEAGVSERTWQGRVKIGDALGQKTRAVLDQADPTDERQRNLLNSTTQLDHLANIARKHGDEEAAGVAEAALTEEGGNTFRAYEERKAGRMGVHYSSETGEWYTPRRVLDRVVAALGEIALDPCAEPGKSVPASSHLTKDDDGLAFEWSGTVFMNPPYGREIAPWVEKLKAHYEAGDVSAAVALVPARTDTEWFALLDAYPRCFVRGRLKFGSSRNSAPFPSAAVYMGPDRAGFVRAFSGLGTIFEAVRP